MVRSPGEGYQGAMAYRIPRRTCALVWLAAAVASCGEPPDPERFAVDSGPGDAPREACADIEPLRRALFGDLHVHTALSSDA